MVRASPLRRGRAVFINDVIGDTRRFFDDGVSELAERSGNDIALRYYVHGISYIDERLMMYWANNDDGGDTVVVQRPYYYVLDRMYNVFGLVDRAGAFVERYGYNGYGRPLIRESCGRGDFDQDTMLTSIDSDRMDEVAAATKWDPRADLDDDGDVDSDDVKLYTDDKYPLWSDDMSGPTVSSAFSDFGNWYMFQGVPHLALDTAAAATAGNLLLNHHRARYADPVTGRWESRDPLFYWTHRDQIPVPSETDSRLRLFLVLGSLIRHPSTAAAVRREHALQYICLDSNPIARSDSSGTECHWDYQRLASNLTSSQCINMMTFGTQCERRSDGTWALVKYWCGGQPEPNQGIACASCNASAFCTGVDFGIGANGDLTVIWWGAGGCTYACSRIS